MTDAEEQPTTCWNCRHPWTSHDPNPDGSRSCRSVGHPRGIPCQDCRAMLTDEYRERVQDERDTDRFPTAWGAYKVTLDDAQNAFGDSAPAFFSDIHQSALASALITYRTALVSRLTALHAPVQHLGKTWCSECSVRRSTGPHTEEWVACIPHPCPTLEAIDHKET